LVSSVDIKHIVFTVLYMAVYMVFVVF